MAVDGCDTGVVAAQHLHSDPCAGTEQQRNVWIFIEFMSDTFCDCLELQSILNQEAFNANVF